MPTNRPTPQSNPPYLPGYPAKVPDRQTPSTATSNSPTWAPESLPLRILEARRETLGERDAVAAANRLAAEDAAEGGCGVIGMACSDRIAGRHLLQALTQMRNRGNGKGGGIAAVGLDPARFGVTEAVLEEDYLLAVAYLDPSSRPEVEAAHIHPTFVVDQVTELPHLADYTTLDGLDVPPPEVVLYFVRVRPEAAAAYRDAHGLGDLAPAQLDDEVVYQNTYRLNKAFYAATGATRAFVLSHGKNMLVLKMVGYADDVVRYYQLEDLAAHVWIGHHRYPTKGRVWHPGGAHPFIGMNEALVHNGDFANYASIGEYLSERNIYPLFLTDTEVSVQVLDLLYRTYRYPLEYVIEALAPTTERDFHQLPPAKQRIYRLLQTAHIHSSPDGPWFFLVAQSDTGHNPPLNAPAPPEPTKAFRLIGITDTSMLRPQVFAVQHGDGATIGFAASEQQGIDAALTSLAAEDPRFWPRADHTWNARGGSHTDGGAFIFTVSPGAQSPGTDGSDKPAMQLVCTDKFGRIVASPNPDKPPLVRLTSNLPIGNAAESPLLGTALWDTRAVAGALSQWDVATLANYLAAVEAEGGERAIEALTWLIDRRFPTGRLRRSVIVSMCEASLARMFDAVRAVPTAGYAYTRAQDAVVAGPPSGDAAATMILDARGFDIEGTQSLALAIVRLRNLGWRRVIVAHAAGHRFIGNGLGATNGLPLAAVASNTNGTIQTGHAAANGHPAGTNGHANGHAAGNGRAEAASGQAAATNGHLETSNGQSSTANGHPETSNGHRKTSNGHAEASSGHAPSENGQAESGKGSGLLDAKDRQAAAAPFRIDVYGASGDYLASGIDASEIRVHGHGQDQLAQIMKGGKLVVFGNVGQTFGYAAKGGQAYVLGNAAGRPLINAVGSPRVVINGTCLDYLAESFMAGDPHNGGGFVVLNGVVLDDDGQVQDLESPYPGGNLFSLASGGCLFVRDPHGRVTADQLNGGEFAPVTPADWALFEPYLRENEALFGIEVARLLEVDGVRRPYAEVYRKIQPAKVRALQAEEAWVAHSDG